MVVHDRSELVGYIVWLIRVTSEIPSRFGEFNAKDIIVLYKKNEISKNFYKNCKENLVELWLLINLQSYV